MLEPHWQSCLWRRLLAQGLQDFQDFLCRGPVLRLEAQARVDQCRYLLRGRDTTVAMRASAFKPAQ